MKEKAIRINGFKILLKYLKVKYEAGKIKEIAIYCGDDIYATYRLFKIWNEFLNL